MTFREPTAAAGKSVYRASVEVQRAQIQRLQDLELYRKVIQETAQEIETRHYLSEQIRLANLENKR